MSTYISILATFIPFRRHFETNYTVYKNILYQQKAYVSTY